MRIALDAMGGDHAPGPIVAGAIKAATANPALHVVLVGDRAQVEPLLAEAGAARDRLEVFHASQAITMDETPIVALRKKPDNSISRCWQLLAERKVEAIVSAGNTGAMVAGGFRLKLFLKNVRRPGIAAILPTIKGPCLLIDVGANVNPKAEHLFQYGIMGEIFAKHILKCEQPRIGLLNVGSEEAKGHDLAKETGTLFKNSSLKANFIGNVEGRDINKGVCDVIVTDGFVGNVVLKLSEGVFEFVMKMAGKELMSTLQNEKQLGQLALQNLLKRYDHHEAGGAPLLGIDGICIICHGSSSDRAIESALGVAAKYIEVRLNEFIVKEIEANPALTAEEQRLIDGGGLGAMMPFKPEHYFQAALERMRQAHELYRVGESYALAMYVAGVAAKCLLRAFMGKRTPIFDTHHDLLKLLDNALLAVDDQPYVARGWSLPAIERHKRAMFADTNEVYLLWRNDFRYSSERWLRSTFGKNTILRKGVRGDLLKALAYRLLNAAQRLLDRGARLWKIF